MTRILKTNNWKRLILKISEIRVIRPICVSDKRKDSDHFVNYLNAYKLAFDGQLFILFHGSLNRYFLCLFAVFLPKRNITQYFSRCTTSFYELSGLKAYPVKVM